MKLILANGTELTPILVTGSPRYVQGANRDSLTFVFSDVRSLDELDTLFTEANCESIKLVTEETVELEDGSTQTNKIEDIHNGYVLRVELRKGKEEVQQATADTEAVYETRATVTMAQRTYAESQIASLTETVDVLVMESLMAE